MIFLLDADIIIYWLKGSRIISDKILTLGYNNISSSIITRAELYYGAFKSLNKEKNLKNIKNLSEKIQLLLFNEACEINYAKIN